MSATQNTSSSPRVVVYHSGYGCDTGCCGHIVQLGDRKKFSFDHPLENELNEETKQWVRDLVTSEFGTAHVADIDWAQVEVFDD